MPETKEMPTNMQKFASGEKPTTNELINYMNECIEESQKDLLEVEDQGTTEPEFNEYADRMKGLIALLRVINEKLIAIRTFENVGNEIISQIHAAKLLEGCKQLINADHYDHFAARMSDSEMEGIDMIKNAITEIEIAQGKEVTHG